MSLAYSQWRHAALEEQVVTPEMAEEILSANPKNRKVKRRHLEDMVRAFKDGRFRFNGETIKIAKTGRLLDGQHRLIACVKTGIPFRTVIVRNLDEEVFDTIDIGSKRTSGDVLSIEGVKNANCVAGGVRWVFALRSENPMGFGNISPDPDEIRDFVLNNPDIIEASNVAYRLRGLVKALALTCGLYHVLRCIDADEAQLYIEDLIEGASLLNGDPALVARNTLMNMQGTARTRGNMGLLNQCAVLVRGWNARIERRNVLALKGVVRGHSGQYIFPPISGLE